MTRFIGFLSKASSVFLGLLIVAWGYLYWEDRQDVMHYMAQKPDTGAVVDRDSIKMAIIGDKRFGWCKHVAWSEYGYAIIDSFQKEVAFRWVDDLTPNSTFDAGPLDAGIAEFTAMEINKASYVGFSVAHVCHNMEKRSHIYWFEVK